MVNTMPASVQIFFKSSRWLANASDSPLQVGHQSKIEPRGKPLRSFFNVAGLRHTVSPPRMALVPPKMNTHSGRSGFDSYTRPTESEYLFGGTASAARTNDANVMNRRVMILFMAI